MEPLEMLSRKQLEALKTVASLSNNQKGVPLKIIATALNIRPPSALELLRALENLHLVSRKSGRTKLTKTGLNCLDEYYRHRRVLEVLFFKLMDQDSSMKAIKEAELAFSHETVQRIWAGEGKPEHCPHGQPIRPFDSGTEG
ncbi:MAG: metal-dependent transcriptional regulator [Thermoplasmata archaeon]